MNPTRIIGRLACILAAQAGAPLASILTAPATLATPRPGHPLEQALSCPGPAWAARCPDQRGMSGQIALIAAGRAGHRDASPAGWAPPDGRR